jgi:2-isopropylmalate synthase
MRDFVNLQEKLNVLEAGYDDVSAEKLKGKVVIEYNGAAVTVEVEGNGRLDCVSAAIKQVTGINYVLENYVEHALEEKSSSKAASYICITADGKNVWGAGIHTDIMTSSVKALVSAVNRLL